MKRWAQSVIMVALPSYTAVLPDTAYALWVRGELAELMFLPETSRVEIIDGEIAVSRAPMHEHTRIVEAIGLPFRGSRFNEPAFPWHCAQGGGLNLVGIEDGYVPDLIILDSLLDSQVSGDHMPVPDQVELVVEVTSASNADIDRRPVEGEARRNKWWGYAKVGIPYYLLVDRSPKLARSTLYSIPDEAAGAYLQEESWAFGEAIVLPEHFGLTIPTDEWTPWEPR